MARQIWLNCQAWLAEHDLSGIMNAPALEVSADTPEKTVFGDVAKTRLGGLVDISAAVNGYFDGSLDGAVFDRLGLIDSVLTMAPDNVDFARAYFFKPAMAKYSPSGKIGDVCAFKVEGKGNGRLIRGNILLPKLARTTSGGGTGRELGAVLATQKVYAALHVFAASAGDTLDVVVQSDALNTFLSPADVLTFTQITAVGHEWKEVAGAITDTWWRISYTIAGVDPSFNFAVVCGII